MHSEPSLRPKKKLGQHFLTSCEIIEKIGEAIFPVGNNEALVEIGPGQGALTDALVGGDHPLFLVEIDDRLLPTLQKKYGKRAKVIGGDFLQLPLTDITEQPIVLVGNLPYNLSSQILFKVLQGRHQIKRVVCMVQHEVALRLTATPKNKSYGILTVLLGAFYDRRYLFGVPPEVFDPPPKVDSAVVSLERNAQKKLGCDERLFIQVVKSAFQQRRKMLRNALLPLGLSLERVPTAFLTQRAEALSVEDFVALTRALS